MPRSGTSWVGQLVESCPSVRYAMSPLFSYAFKNAVREGATRAEWEDVFRGAYQSDDEFINQTHRRRTHEYPTFATRDESPATLVVKFNRFQTLVPELLDCFPELKLVCIVRHPCGAIHSWLTTPKEFPPEADPMTQWRTGAVKKTGYGDNFGFDDWKWVTRMHARLAEERPEQVRLEQYEHLVEDPEGGVRRIFDFFGLPVMDQTMAFLQRSRRTVVEGHYSVFKPPSVKDRWRLELQPAIRDAILADLAGTDLERFAP